MDHGANGLTPPRGRVMQTFRLPRELVVFLKAEAAQGSRDLTAHVVRWLEGLRSYFGLPEAATALMELDRKVLGMERFEYMLHALYQRSLVLREKGPGFDAPSGKPGQTTGAMNLESWRSRDAEK
jgi:hypothetical protein